MIKTENSKPELWAIILAGGESKRMNAPKMLLPFHGKTIIEKVIENVGSSEVKNIIVVLGAFKEEIHEVVKKLPVSCCYNENYRDGMLSSVLCGLRNLPENCNPVLIFQGDQPMIGKSVIDAVIRAYGNSQRGIVMPVFGNKRGHPLLIDIKYREEIGNLNPEEGLRSLAAKFNTDVLEVELNNPEILTDIDTHEDYIRELNKS
jgi:molybdenum cofactor cytidylyltransferase